MESCMTLYLLFEIEYDARTSYAQGQNINLDSHLPKKFVLFASLKASFKIDEKCFLCHLKSSFRSQDI